MEQEGFDRACRFLNALVAAEQSYGVSSTEMESMLVRVAHALHIQGQFLATPTQVQSILWDDDEDGQRLHISVARAGDFDLNKLAQISELVEHVVSGEITPDIGLSRIRAIKRAGPEYGPAINAMAFVLCGLGFGVILGIPWLDVLLGGALGIVSFGLTRLAMHSRGLKRTLEVLVAGTSALLATLLAHVLPVSNPEAVTVCAFIFFVPGFGLTLAAGELMKGNTLSGLIGLTGAAVIALKLAIGVLIGTAIVHDLAPLLHARVEPGVPHAWTWLAAPILVLGLSILFRVRRKDLVWSLVGGVTVWLGVELGSRLGYWHGTFIGAFLLMFTSRVFALLSRLPPAIILLPAVMLLVPGVAALQVLYTTHSLGAIAGLQSTSHVFVLIASILGGLLCGETVWIINRAAISTVTSRFSRIFRKNQDIKE